MSGAGQVVSLEQVAAHLVHLADRELEDLLALLVHVSAAASRRSRREAGMRLPPAGMFR